MALEFLVPTKLIAGSDSVFRLPYELELRGVKRPMLLTDNGVMDAGVFSVVKMAFDEYRFNLPVVFSDIPPETSLRSVREAYRLFREENCDGIIALGGGSVIDTGKALNMMVSEGTDDLIALSGADNITKKGVIFVAIPTTAGTGSEVTGVAVIFDENSGSKIAFASEFLIPDIAVLEPKLTISMPGKLTAASGIDALSHAIESYIGIQSNEVSRALSFRATRLIFDNLLKAIENGKDKDVRFNMLLAATMAGMAFSNSMVGIIHSLAHAAGTALHIPHGVAVSLFLIAGLIEGFDVSKSDLSELLDAVRCDFSGDEDERAGEFLNVVRDFLTEVRRLSGLPSGLLEVGYKPELEKKIVELALADGSSIFSRVELTEKVVKRMIEASL